MVSPPHAEPDTHASSVHSFIVKLWLEPPADKGARASWHGSITHVPDGNRQYLRELDDITDFIGQYLLGEGAEIRRGGRVRRWLRRWGRGLGAGAMT